MKLAASLFVLAMVLFLVSATSQNVNCNFDVKRPAFCGWKREWFGMRRAGWRIGKKIRRFALQDHTTGAGKFIYFLSRSRPVGFRSRLRSEPISPRPGSCLKFWLAMGGTKQPFPNGNAVLKLYVVAKSDQVESTAPVWTKTDGTSKVNGFEEMIVPLDAAVDYPENGPVQLVFETVRGKSRKSVVAIDDVSLTPCAKVTVRDHEDEDLEAEHDAFDNEAEKKMHDVEKTLIDLMLPARTSGIKVMQFSNPPFTSNGTEPSSAPRLISESDVNEIRNQHIARRPLRRGRKGRKRKGKKGTRKVFSLGENRRRDRIENLYLRRSFHNFHPILEPTLPADPASPTMMCDFIQYTQRLGRCFRSFFSALQRRPKTCGAQYMVLESCLRNAALSCVPNESLDQTRVEEIVMETLQDKLQTRKVFCKENGAFVYPQFAVDKLPIQCGTRYFIKLSECSGSFSSLFHVQHGDPQLCRLYYKANECQRQAMADECNFDVETMLLYGLKIQYQIAHNPFCLNLPFSSWWPES